MTIVYTEMLVQQFLFIDLFILSHILTTDHIKYALSMVVLWIYVVIILLIGHLLPACIPHILMLACKSIKKS